MRASLIPFLAVSLPAAVVLASASAADPPAAKPKQVVLIAGPLDAGHPKGTHEYEKTVRVLKHCLDTAKDLRGVTATVHTGGWPREEKVLDEADAIVLVASGSDRREQDHPALVGDRLVVLGRQMKRGCGLVCIHWCTFFPNGPAGEKALDWLGGHFDYQSGPPPRRWASAIQHVTTTAEPATKDHPVWRGVAPFRVRDEFYYKLRFRPDDNRLSRLVNVAVPGEKDSQTVMWAVERTDGGRGVGFTGGHYFDNWWLPEYRKLVLNAVVWAAKADVPAKGVDAVPPAPAEFDPVSGDPDWTPRPTVGAKEPYEVATDKDWVDARLRAMDTGPTFNATFAVPDGRRRQLVYKGTAFRVGERGEAAWLFDRAQMRWVAGWTGGFLEHSSRRFGLLNTPTPAGTIVCSTRPGVGWASMDGGWPTSPSTLPPGNMKLTGILAGARPVVALHLRDDGIFESPWVEKSGQTIALTRDAFVKPPAKLKAVVAEVSAGNYAPQTIDGVSLAVHVQADHVSSAVAVVGTGVTLRVAGPRVEVDVAARTEPAFYKVLCWRGPSDQLGAFARLVKESKSATIADWEKWLKPGPARWTDPIVTAGEVAPDNAPYVIDTLTVPYDNPHKALFFLTGVDALPNGDLAVCTAHGDVWLVRGVDASLRRLTWKRFATGLYQPMGLKVVDGKIVVLERGQLTRLHDQNGDGEADFYENLCNAWHTGAGEHSYDACLETDPDGNFYLFKSGDPELPHGGCLLRVSKDGSKVETFATGFRHPIGLGMSPTGIVTGADQEGNWMPATRIDEYRRGGFYGDMRTHHRPTPPRIFDPPLCWLPREADNSAGGQVWVPDGRFGPLAGRPLHLSFGRCKAMLLMRQVLPDGTVQGGATDLGWKFLSGVKSGRFNPHDGHLYVVGLTGWQTSAQRDGCLQRVRYTGLPATLPLSVEAFAGELRLTFSQPLDAKRAADVGNYRIERWNYHWSGEYGSKRYSADRPSVVGQDPVPVTAARLDGEGRTVVLTVPTLKSVMQMEVSFKLTTRGGGPCPGVVYHTIHQLPQRP